MLDTHLIYWWMTADACLGSATQRIIEQSEIVVSAVSVWEMVLKNGKGKLPLPQGAITEQLEAQGFTLLPILPRHIEAVRGLTCPHADPFDRHGTQNAPYGFGSYPGPRVSLTSLRRSS